MDDKHWLRTYLIAHRGFHNGKSIIENSLSSFKEAMNYNYGIELDVRLTKDNQVVVFHDHSLKRICGETGTIEGKNLSELQATNIKHTKEHIPTLAEVLDFVDGAVPLLIELKTHHNANKISHEVYKLLQSYTGDYAIQSFNPRVINWYRKKAPSILRGQIAQHNKRKEKSFIVRFYTNYLLFYRLTKPNFINYRLKDLPLKKLDYLYKTGLPVISFTAKSQKDLDFVKKHYDNAVFEGFHPKKEPTKK